MEYGNLSQNVGENLVGFIPRTVGFSLRLFMPLSRTINIVLTVV